MNTVKVVDLELCTVTTATGGTSKTEQFGSKEAITKELARLLDDGFGKLTASSTVITLVKNDIAKRRVGMLKVPDRPIPPETFTE